MRSIYLDYNATTPIAPAVQESMLPYLAEFYGNPSSSHVLGRACHEAIEDARGRLASLLGADRDEIVFTSCGTESNNLAIKGVALRHGPLGHGHVIISALEHPAVVEPARFLERLGYELSVVPCDSGGLVDPDRVASEIRQDTLLVSIQHANNEVGALQPIQQVAEICHDRGVLLHTDACQSVGKVPVRVRELGVDLLTLTGHKFYAPKGVGALYVRRGVALESLLHGAGHEGGRRAGTENVPFIVALGRAATLVENHLADSVDRMAMLRDRLRDRLEHGIAGLTVNSAAAPRIPNTLSVNFPGVNAAELLRRCPELCASTGAACHAETTHVSATLSALGLPPEVAAGTVRLSAGWYTTEEEIDRAAALLIAGWENLR